MTVTIPYITISDLGKVLEDAALERIINESTVPALLNRSVDYTQGLIRKAEATKAVNELRNRCRTACSLYYKSRSRDYEIQRNVVSREHSDNIRIANADHDANCQGIRKNHLDLMKRNEDCIDSLRTKLYSLDKDKEEYLETRRAIDVLTSHRRELQKFKQDHMLDESERYSREIDDLKQHYAHVMLDISEGQRANLLEREETFNIIRDTADKDLPSLLSQLESKLQEFRKGGEL